MKQKVEFKFNDSRLQNIRDEKIDDVKAYLKMLDDLSFDIKKLVCILKDYGIGKGISLRIDQCHSLEWDGTDLLCHYDGDSRRLIETPKEIRLKCKNHLPVFFDKCIEAINKLKDIS